MGMSFSSFKKDLKDLLLPHLNESIIDNVFEQAEEKRDFYVVQQNNIFKVFQRGKLCWETSVEKVNQVFRIVKNRAVEEQKTSAIKIFELLVVVNDTDVEANRYLGNRKKYHDDYYAEMKVLHFYGIIYHKGSCYVDLLKPNFVGFKEDTYERVIIEEEESQMGLDAWV